MSEEQSKNPMSIEEIKREQLKALDLNQFSFKSLLKDIKDANVENNRTGKIEPWITTTLTFNALEMTLIIIALELADSLDIVDQKQGIQDAVFEELQDMEVSAIPTDGVAN